MTEFAIIVALWSAVTILASLFIGVLIWEILK
jgi:hypothetical protein